MVIADKAYDSNALIELIEGNNSVPVIPPKKNRKTQRGYDSHVYKERHLIECFFGKIKHLGEYFLDSIKHLRLLWDF
jgi:transposase